jgi:hypothetical protein
LLGGLDCEVRDFNATAVAALGAEEAVLGGLGGAAEALGVGAAGGDDGRQEPPAGAAGFGATDEAGATDGAAAVIGLGAMEALAVGPAAGAREGVAAAGFVKSGGAGIDVSPVAGPGPRGAAG